MNPIGKAMRNPRAAARLLRHRVGRLVGQRDYRPFILLGRSRTGSNLLVSYLNSHPAVHAEGEVLGRLAGRPYRRLLERAWGKQPRGIRAAGFKLFYYHPVDAPDCGLWEELAADPELAVIHLKRRNVLRTLVSWKLAESRDAWRADGSARDGGLKRVRFTHDELRAGFERTRGWERERAALFAGHPLVELAYEDLVSRPAEEFARVTDLLGVERRPPLSPLARQNPEPLSELIEGYASLAGSFAGTEWAPFFEG